MKQPSSILATILHQPQFKRLDSGYCFKKFISLLQPKFQRAIAFVYIKNATLFIALSHPGFKMELNYNLDMLKSIFKMLIANDTRCQGLAFNQVKIFNSNKISIVKDKTEHEDSVPYYNELAQGNFSVESEDSELIEKFRAIKESIKRNTV